MIAYCGSVVGWTLAIAMITPISGDPPDIRLLPCHNPVTFALAFSPDGQTLATAGKGRTPEGAAAQLWDVAAGRERVALAGHRSTIYDVAFTPDGKTVVTAGADGTARLWDLKGVELAVLRHPAQVHRLAISRDGSTLATCCRKEGTIRLWDIQGRALKRGIKTGAGEITDISFSPDGRTLASSSPNLIAQLWDVEGGTLLKNFPDAPNNYFGIQFSPDGKTLAINSYQDRKIRLLDVSDGSVKTVIPLWSTGFMTFSREGSTFYAGGFNDHNIHAYEIPSGHARESYRGGFSGPNPPNGIAVSPDGHTLAWGGSADDNTVRILRLPMPEARVGK